MLRVTGFVTDIGELSEFEGDNGPEITAPVKMVHSAEELSKPKPFSEFFIAGSVSLDALTDSLKSGKPVTVLVKETILPRKSGGSWVKRFIRQVL